jgi:hypothetical protein
LVMLVIKLDEENTPEIRERLSKIVALFKVVSFAWEDDNKAPERPRPGATGQDLGSSLSSAVDRISRP